MAKIDDYLNQTGLAHFWAKIKAWVNSKIATDSEYGFVKLNPSQSVDVDSDGKLTVGGRLGQFPNGGVYYGQTIEPRMVGNNSFLISDSLGMEMNSQKAFGLVSGVSINLTTNHPAGSTTYTVANTYTNRIICKCLEGGFVSDANLGLGGDYVKSVTSVKINGDTFTPDSSNDDSTNPITITVAESANPDAPTNKLFFYGKMNGNANLFIGQNVSSGTVNYCSVIGSSVSNLSGNFSTVSGYMNINKGNSCALFGRQHINSSGKNNVFFAGCGHENAVANEGVAAVGLYSKIDINTAFAVGVGKYTGGKLARGNAFEVTKKGELIVPSSTSGSTKKFKITVDDSGTISATEV